MTNNVKCIKLYKINIVDSLKVRVTNIESKSYPT